MGIFNKQTTLQVEQQKQEIDELKQTINSLSNDFTSLQDIAMKASIESSNAAMNVLTDFLRDSKMRYNGTTFNEIQKNQIPSYMAWDYWVIINQWADYWVNRYSEFDHDSKENILTAIRIACLFGVGAVVKTTMEPVSCFRSKNEFICYSAYDSLNSTFATYEKNKLIIDKADKLEKIRYKRDELFIFTWRFNDIGDFVWCLKDVLTDIYLKKIIECNASQLTNKTYMKVKNSKTLATELAIANDPFTNVAFEISDEGANDTGNSNKFITNIKNNESHIDALITAHKNHIEYYYNKFGRVITSSKQQSLSSDANLSVSSAELIADEHDRRVVATLKEMGIQVDVNEIDPNEQPQNDNADQEAEATENTNGHHSAEKGENQ